MPLQWSVAVERSSDLPRKIRKRDAVDQNFEFARGHAASWFKVSLGACNRECDWGAALPDEIVIDPEAEPRTEEGIIGNSPF
ncbi:MAG TPA: hypothetical protein VM912_08000 [Terriglobales bacterium]|nr:hypothetical protein [Terriglobales bacterium]